MKARAQASRRQIKRPPCRLPCVNLLARFLAERFARSASSSVLGLCGIMSVSRSLLRRLQERMRALASQLGVPPQQ